MRSIRHLQQDGSTCSNCRFWNMDLTRKPYGHCHRHAP